MYKKTYNDLLEIFEKELAKVKYPSRAKGLYTPIEYTLESGGKRLRPILCMAACAALGGRPSDAVNQAIAIEMFHNFTLIHDDVMDGSNLRRNRPTVFSKWGSTQAILSGDALLTMASQKLTDWANCEKIPRLIDWFNTTALEVYEGQQLDMDFENRDDVTTDEYLEMIRLKTSVLLGCACAIGAEIATNVEYETIASFNHYGEQLGIAFQLRDDWLDTFGDSAEFGKPIGGDIRNRKKTWLFITAQTEAPHAMAEALKADENDIVEKVIHVYDSLGLSERCDKMIEHYCNEAISALDFTSIISEEWYEWFKNLAIDLCKRTK